MAVGVARLGGFLLELGDCCLHAAVHHGGGEGGEDAVEPVAGGVHQGGLAKAGYIGGREGLLHGSRGDGDFRHLVMLAIVGEALLGPCLFDDVHALEEGLLAGGEVCPEGLILAGVVATAR